VEAHRHRPLEAAAHSEPETKPEPMTIGEAEQILTELARRGSVRAAELMLRRLEANPEPGTAMDDFAEVDEIRRRRERDLAARGASP
jgi:hypothetical protein